MFKDTVLIGLTGRSGSGKTLISDLLGGKGVSVINADEVYHKLTVNSKKMLDELSDAFGRKIMNSDGSLNRASLAGIVFNDKEKLNLLNKITHKYVRKAIREKTVSLFEAGSRIVLIDAPTLFESGINKKCDEVLVAFAPEDVLIERIKKRDGISEEKAKERLSSQLPSEYMNNHADNVINTDTAIEEIDRFLSEYISELKKKYGILEL